MMMGQLAETGSGRWRLDVQGEPDAATVLDVNRKGVEYAATLKSRGEDSLYARMKERDIGPGRWRANTSKAQQALALALHEQGVPFDIVELEDGEEPNRLEQPHKPIKPPKAEQPADVIHGESKAQQLERLIRELSEDGPSELDEERVRALAREEIAANPSKGGGAVEVKLSDTGKTVTIDGKVHVSFKRALQVLTRGTRRTLMLVGPAGTGKTRLARALALAMEAECVIQSFTEDVSVAQVMGYRNADGSYAETDFVRIVEHGGVYCADEFDAADANVRLAFNAVLDGAEEITLPQRSANTTCKVHPEFHFVACCNTFGAANSWEYSGRSHQDAASGDRFALRTLYIGYDPALERAIAQDYANAADKSQREAFKTYLSDVQKIRANVLQYSLREIIVSTRAVQEGCEAILHGDSMTDVRSALSIAWTDQDRTRAFEGCSHV